MANAFAKEFLTMNKEERLGHIERSRIIRETASEETLNTLNSHDAEAAKRLSNLEPPTIIDQRSEAIA